MIEDIEGFQAQLELFRFSDFGGFCQRRVEVVESWTVKEPPSRISQYTNLLLTEQGGVELGSSVARVGIFKDRSTAGKIRNIDRSSIRANQRVVIILSQRNGKPGGEVRNARQTPPTDNFSSPTGADQFVERQQPVVAENEVMHHVEIAKAFAEAWIKRIKRVLQSGGVVHALAEGVPSEKTQRSCVVTHADLQGVVTRVGYCGDILGGNKGTARRLPT